MYTYKYTFSSFYSSSSSFVLLFLGRPFYEPSQGQTDALKLSRHRTGNIQQTTDEYIHSTTSRVFHHQHTPVLDDAEKDGIVCVHANENFPLKKQREGGTQRDIKAVHGWITRPCTRLKKQNINSVHIIPNWGCWNSVQIGAILLLHFWFKYNNGQQCRVEAVTTMLMVEYKGG